MAQINPRTFSDAKQLGDNIYELILTNWGNRGLAQDADNGSISYPPVKSIPKTPPFTGTTIPIIGEFTLPPIPSLSAIAIAPRSDLDRCILNFSSLPQTPPQQVPPFVNISEGFVENGGILDTEQVLSVHAPLIGQLVGPIVIRAYPAHWFGDTYILSDGGTTKRPFGTAIDPARDVSNGLANPGRPLWTNPQLRLLLYLNGRGALPPPVRAPFHLERVHIFTTAVEELLLVVPIMGRKFVRIAYRAAFSDVDIKISGTFHTQFRPGVLGDIDAQDWEVPLFSDTVLGNEGKTFTCNCELTHTNLSYLLIKAKAGVLQLGRFTVDAYD
jgi:hypothetical protein